MPSILTRPVGGGGGGIQSVSLALSDTTPDFGDTITLTATASDFASGDDLTYQFIVRDNVGNWEKIEQTNDNTYDWSIPYAGTYMVHVIVEDESGGSASDSVEVTVGTLNDKYTFTGLYDVSVRTLVGQRLDEVTDGSGNSNDAAAPSAADRPVYESSPLVNSGITRCDAGTSQRLVTPISTLQSTITLVAVFHVSNQATASPFNAHPLIAGNGTRPNGGRFAIVFNTGSGNTVFSSVETSGATSVLDGYQNGWNIAVGTFDGSTVRLNLNGNVTTAAFSGTLATDTSAFQLQNIGSDSGTYHNKIPNTDMLTFAAIKTTNLSDADADQLYADLLLKFPYDNN